MGVESEFFILPASSGYRPEPAQVIQLIQVLRAKGYLCDPQSPDFVASLHQPNGQSSTAEGEGFSWEVVKRRHQTGSLSTLEQQLADLEKADVRIHWRNSDLQQSGLKYPLDPIPGPEEVYYDLEIHLAAHPIYHISEIIEPFTEILCPCGAEIEEFEAERGSPFYDSRLPNHCPSCGAPMNYAQLPMIIRDGWTGAETEAVGGVTYRFGVVVDCGKYWPDQKASVASEFLEVIEQTLGIKTRVVRDFS